MLLRWKRKVKLPFKPDWRSIHGCRRTRMSLLLAVCGKQQVLRFAQDDKCFLMSKLGHFSSTRCQRMPGRRNSWNAADPSERSALRSFAPPDSRGRLSLRGFTRLAAYSTPRRVRRHPARHRCQSS
jgi:hypothetical protein